MKLAVYQVDAFAARPFEGNPAAVCPLTEWLPDELMQQIAMENNLSETAFFVAAGDHYQIRWFTPLKEVRLCGHATLASAYVLFHFLQYAEPTIRFNSLSGLLTVTREGERLTLDFPACPPTPCETPANLEAALGVRPEACLVNEDLLVVLADETAVRTCRPDQNRLLQLDFRGVIVTAAAEDYDFVARFFAPRVGVPEDPVTGSAYTRLAPYWAQRTGKTRLRARQLSARGGDVTCELRGDRVLISGTAVPVLQGYMDIP